MARRGEKLREHILWQAKDVFLELGFERASMDLVAARAETSKRSLYAHFENKERLFLAVIDLVRGLFIGRLKMPGDYSDDAQAALVQFCGRYLQTVLYEKSVQMMRLSMAESKRFPDGAAQYFDVIFAEVEMRLGAYLQAKFVVTADIAQLQARSLLGRVLYPRLTRALFGIDTLPKSIPDDLSPDLDLSDIRRAVSDLVRSLAKP